MAIDFVKTNAHIFHTNEFFDVCPSTLTNWSKRQEWIELQNELVEKRREQILNEVDVALHLAERSF